jgi:hypothetical protein
MSAGDLEEAGAWGEVPQRTTINPARGWLLLTLTGYEPENYGPFASQPTKKPTNAALLGVTSFTMRNMSILFSPRTLCFTRYSLDSLGDARWRLLLTRSPTTSSSPRADGWELAGYVAASGKPFADPVQT